MKQNIPERSQESNFPTKIESFDSSYQKNDLLQKDFNSNIVPIYSEIIAKAYFAQGNKHPFAILDLCCGYGEPTFNLMERLIKIRGAGR